MGAGTDQLQQSYDVAQMSKYLDYINLMTYDYNEGDKTSHNSPLSGPGETIHSTVDHWLKHGADSKKLLLGVPLYGKAFKLDGSADHTKVGARAHEDGSQGGNFNKICKNLKAGGWTEHWDDAAGVPFATKGHEWVSFDNAKSIQKKLDYVLEKKLGGSFVWPVDGDDCKLNYF